MTLQASASYQPINIDQSIQEGEQDISSELDKLLFAWAISYGIGGNRRAIAIMTGQINKSPTARLMRDALEQIGELDINARNSFQLIYSDECLLFVNRLINALPDRLRKVIEANYKWYEGLPIAERARRLKIDRRTYYRQLSRAHCVMFRAMDWRLAR